MCKSKIESMSMSKIKKEKVLSSFYLALVLDHDLALVLDHALVHANLSLNIN